MGLLWKLNKMSSLPLKSGNLLKLRQTQRSSVWSLINGGGYNKFILVVKNGIKMLNTVQETPRQMELSKERIENTEYETSCRVV